MIAKYRAWDKELKTMLDVSLIDFKKRVLVGEHWEFGETNFMGFDEIELMQSTGLKDKNGQEIFEGDILELKDCGETIGNVKVCWDDLLGLVQLDAIIVDEKEPMYKVVDDEDYSYIVVGNIYENPELLEDIK